MASNTTTRARLTDAISEQHIIRVGRDLKFADRLDGFIVAVGDEWALMAQTWEGGFSNGYAAFRLRDVKRIRRDKTFETAFAKTQPEWPPAQPFEVGLDSTRDVLEGMGRNEELIGIQKERERSAIWIGRLDEIRKRLVYLREVRPDATWHDALLGYRLKAITTVEVRTRYLTALAAIAGSNPTPSE